MIAAGSSAFGLAAAPLVALVPAMVLTFAVHELGHLLVGLALGQRVVLFIAGPLKVLRVDGRIRAGVNRRLAYWGGMALTAPPVWKGDARFRRESAALLAGGPVASVVFGTACLAATVALGNHLRTIVYSPSLFILLMLGAMSLAVGATTLLPGAFTSRGRSDGARIRALLQAHEHIAPLTVLGPLIHLLPPSAWPSEIVDRLRSNLEARPSFREGVLLHRRLLDVGDVAGAAQVLAQAEQSAATDAERAAAAVERVVFAALWDRDVAAARAAFSGLEATGHDVDALIARAALAAASGATADAARLVNELVEQAWAAGSPGMLLAHAATIGRIRDSI